jgi:hypothetical protein
MIYKPNNTIEEKTIAITDIAIIETSAIASLLKEILANLGF